MQNFIYKKIIRKLFSEFLFLFLYTLKISPIITAIKLIKQFLKSLKDSCRGFIIDIKTRRIYVPLKIQIICCT